MATEPLKLLGFAHRARKLVIGTTGVLTSLRRGTAKAVVLAADLSRHSLEKMVRQAEHSRVPWIKLSSKRELGQALGRNEVGVVAITDAQFAEAIRRAGEASQQE